MKSFRCYNKSFVYQQRNLLNVATVEQNIENIHKYHDDFIHLLFCCMGSLRTTNDG